MTKNDLYAHLTREGLRRHYDVISEYVVQLEAGTRKIDLVWATRRNAHPGPQNAPNVDYWNLIAVFEIEGCNVRNLPNEFGRHLITFPIISELYGQQVEKCVVLYTSAYDRDWNHNRPEEFRNAEITVRVGWGGEVVRVIDGRHIAEWTGAQFPLPAVQ